MTFVNERKHPGHRRAIDYERNIVLTAVSLVDPDGLKGFFLDWNGLLMEFISQKDSLKIMKLCSK
jgi:hypothetical protein